MGVFLKLTEFLSFIILFSFIFSNVKPLSEVAPRLLVIQIQAVCWRGFFRRTLKLSSFFVRTALYSWVALVQIKVFLPCHKASLLRIHMPFPFNHVLEFLLLFAICLLVPLYIFSFNNTRQYYSLYRAVLVLWTAYLSLFVLPLYLFSIHSFEFAFCFEGYFFRRTFKLSSLWLRLWLPFATPLLLSHRFWYFMRSLGISAFMILLIYIIYMRSVLLASLIQHHSGGRTSEKGRFQEFRPKNQ